MAIVNEITFAQKRRDHLISLRTANIYMSYIITLLISMVIFQMITDQIMQFRVLTSLIILIGTLTSVAYLVGVREKKLNVLAIKYDS